MPITSIASNLDSTSYRSVVPNPVRVITVSGGKGGIGKTCVAINLGRYLQASGKNVMLLDADLGLANIDVLLGLTPKCDLSHVIEGQQSLEDIILEGPGGMKIVPAGSGIAEMASVSSHEQAGLIRAFSELREVPDVLIVDTAAGIHRNVVNFCVAAQEVVVTVCNEPASLTDAYALIKVLWRDYGINRFRILANMVSNRDEGYELYNKLSAVATRYLQVSLDFIGAVPFDPYLRKSIMKQKTILECYPNAPAAREFQRVANGISSWGWDNQNAGTRLEFFVEHVLASQQRFVEGVK